MDIIQELTRVLETRRGADPETSYVAALYAGGLNKILEKVGEEATEVVLAAKDADGASDAGKRAALVHEVADLWFHTMVLLVSLGEEPARVLKALESRFGVSGHEEKRGRP